MINCDHFNMISCDHFKLRTCVQIQLKGKKNTVFFFFFRRKQYNKKLSYNWKFVTEKIFTENNSEIHYRIGRITYTEKSSLFQTEIFINIKRFSITYYHLFKKQSKNFEYLISVLFSFFYIHLPCLCLMYVCVVFQIISFFFLVIFQFFSFLEISIEKN